MQRVEGPGVVFPDHAWSGIHKPALILTGTGLSHDKVEPLVTGTITSFLAGAQQHACILLSVETGMTLQAK